MCVDSGIRTRIHDDGRVFFDGGNNNAFVGNTACINGSNDVANNGQANTGNTNTCDTTDQWNDDGVTGCTLACDRDGDGLLNAADRCPTSIPDTMTLNPENYAQKANWGAFEAGPKDDQSLVYTMETTNGCTCTEIADKLGIGLGAAVKGCSPGNMKAFTNLDFQRD